MTTRDDVRDVPPDARCLYRALGVVEVIGLWAFLCLYGVGSAAFGLLRVDDARVTWRDG